MRRFAKNFNQTSKFMLTAGLIFGLVAQPLLSTAATQPLDIDPLNPGGGGSSAAPTQPGVTPLTIEGTVFDDSDANGVFDQATETGLENWSVELSTACVQEMSRYNLVDNGSDPMINLQDLVAFSQLIVAQDAQADVNGDTYVSQPDIDCFGVMFNGGTLDDLSHVILGSTLSDANGYYAFPDLENGTYKVCEELQSNWNLTYPSAACVEHTVAQNLANPAIQDFGNYLPGQITGQVWNDLDGDGIKEMPDETPLENWTLQLRTSCAVDFAAYDLAVGQDGEINLQDFVAFSQLYTAGNMSVDLNGDGILSDLDVECFGYLFNQAPGSQVAPTEPLVLATTTSDVDGNYAFGLLEPGQYWISETIQADWTQTEPDPEVNDGMHGPISILSQTFLPDMDFGNQQDDDSTDDQGGPTDNRTPVIDLDKEAVASATAVGQNISYTLNYTVSDAQAGNLVLTDALPEFTSFVSASNGGTYDVATNKVTWSLGTVAPGNYIESITLAIDDVVPNGTVITNVARLSGQGLAEVQDDAVVTVSSRPMLVVEKMVNIENAKTGDTLLYTVRITNEGSDVAENVKISDVLPSGFTTVDGAVSAFEKTFGTLNVGASVSTSYEVNIGASVTSGTHVNTVTASADNADPVTATASVNVSAGQVLGVADEAEDNSAQQNQGQVLGASDTLPETGAGAADVALLLLGAAMVFGAAMTLRKTVVPVVNK